MAMVSRATDGLGASPAAAELSVDFGIDGLAGDVWTPFGKTVGRGIAVRDIEGERPPSSHVAKLLDKTTADVGGRTAELVLPGVATTAAFASNAPAIAAEHRFAREAVLPTLAAM